MISKIPVLENDVLVVIDVQNDFCAGGAFPVPGGDEIVPVINRLAKQFQHVILTQDWHPPGHSSFASAHPGRKPFEILNLDYGAQKLWPDHCIQGSWGAEFHSRLQVPHAELILRRGFRRSIDSCSAFYENDRWTPTGLIGYLHERKFSRIFFAGLAFDCCVRCSAEDGHREGFAIAVVEDACRGWDLDHSPADVQMMFAGPNVRRVTAGALGV